jgi:hypothetical protein
MIATSEAIAKTQRAFMAEILFQIPYNCREQAITLIDPAGLRSARWPPNAWIVWVHFRAIR